MSFHGHVRIRRVSFGSWKSFRTFRNQRRLRRVRKSSSAKSPACSAASSADGQWTSGGRYFEEKLEPVESMLTASFTSWARNSFCACFSNSLKDGQIFRALGTDVALRSVRVKRRTAEGLRPCRQERSLGSSLPSGGLKESSVASAKSLSSSTF